MSSRARFLVDKAREIQNKTPLSRTRPKNQIKNNLEENLFSDSDSFQEYSSDDDYNPSSIQAISETSPGYNGYIESANIILKSPKKNENDNNCLSTYESLASSRKLLFNGSDLNTFNTDNILETNERPSVVRQLIFDLNSSDLLINNDVLEIESLQANNDTTKLINLLGPDKEQGLIYANSNLNIEDINVIPETPQANRNTSQCIFYELRPTATDNIQPEAFNDVIDEPINDVLLEKKASRKRTLNQNNWKRKKATIERKTGKQYTTQKGVIVPAKRVNEGQLCMSKCRLKCTTTVNLERRKLLFESYYKMDTNVKNAYLFKSLRKFETARVSKTATRVRSCSFKYFVKSEISEIQVCKPAFCEIFQIGRKKVDIIQQRHTEGASPHEDLQGKHSNRPHKIQDHVVTFIVEHINPFPADSSHYSRNNNPNRKYLSPTLNIHQLFLLYIEKCDEKNKPQCYKVKEGTYRNIFCTKFNLGFGSPQSDTCSKCDSGESENAEHINLYKTAFEVQKRDREYALENPSTCFMTMDLQQTMPLPKLSTSKAFYLRQIWFYNFGIHTITSENGHKPFMFSWTEEVAGKGSNEVGSCLMYFTQLSQLTFQQNIKHLIIWSDSCSGQNKNFNIICLYQYMILKGLYEIIDHKFPEVGHSYLDSDRDFGRVEKKLRKHQNIYTPEQYRQIITEASKKNAVISDMKHHFQNIEILPSKLRLVNKKKNIDGQKVYFRDSIKWIRTSKFGSYQYKESHDETVPFKTVHILKDKTNNANNYTLERLTDNTGNISKEKLDNIRTQVQFVPDEFKWFYEQYFLL